MISSFKALGFTCAGSKRGSPGSGVRFSHLQGGRAASYPRGPRPYSQPQVQTRR